MRDENHEKPASPEGGQKKPRAKRKSAVERKSGVFASEIARTAAAEASAAAATACTGVDLDRLHRVSGQTVRQITSLLGLSAETRFYNLRSSEKNPLTGVPRQQEPLPDGLDTLVAFYLEDVAMLHTDMPSMAALMERLGVDIETFAMLMGVRPAAAKRWMPGAASPTTPDPSAMEISRLLWRLLDIRERSPEEGDKRLGRLYGIARAVQRRRDLRLSKKSGKS